MKCGGNVFRFEVTSDGGTVVYMADQEVYRDYELYSLPADGSGRTASSERIRGHARLLAQLRAESRRNARGLLRRGQHLVGPGRRQRAPPVELDTPPPGASMGDTDPFFRISPDNQWLLFWNEGEGGLWSAPTDGSTGQRIDPGVQFVPGTFAFTPDSTRVLYQANPSFAGWEIFSAALDGSGEFSLGASEFRTPIVPAADGARVVFFTDGEVFSVPSDGGAPAVALNGALGAFDRVSFVGLADQRARGVPGFLRLRHLRPLPGARRRQRGTRCRSTGPRPSAASRSPTRSRRTGAGRSSRATCATSPRSSSGPHASTARGFAVGSAGPSGIRPPRCSRPTRRSR